MKESEGTGLSVSVVLLLLVDWGEGEGWRKVRDFNYPDGETLSVMLQNHSFLTMSPASIYAY